MCDELKEKIVLLRMPTGISKTSCPFFELDYFIWKATAGSRNIGTCMYPIKKILVLKIIFKSDENGSRKMHFVHNIKNCYSRICFTVQ